MVNRLVLSAYVNSTGTVLSISAVAALWSSSRGMYSFVTGLNAIYDVKEDRGYVRTRLMSMGYTFAFLLVLILTLVLHVFGGDLLQMLQELPIPAFLLNLLDLRVFVLLILQTALFCAMFMVLPNERNRLGESLPGALLASIGWQVFTNVYSIYSQKFTSYASIYGSVSVVALGMLWLYFCICIVFYGGVLNKTLQKLK
jgi:membrane protein